MFRQDIVVQKATIDHVEGISRVCSEGWGDTYRELYPIEYIDVAMERFAAGLPLTENCIQLNILSES